MGGHSGGSWKVAYADFVTAMMAFFLVMWITSQSKKIKEAIAFHFNAPYESIIKKRSALLAGQTMGAMPGDMMERSPIKNSGGLKGSPSMVDYEIMRQIQDRLLKALKGDPQEGNSIKLELTNDGLNIIIFNRAKQPVFKPHSAELTTYGDWVFGVLSWEISRHSEFGLRLDGHFKRELAATGSSVDLWELSALRASRVRRVLIQHGIKPEQVRCVSGYADTKPMEDALPEDEANNRVVVLLSAPEKPSGY